MAKPYSLDLRERAMARLAAGERQAALSVAVSSVIEWWPASDSSAASRRTHGRSSAFRHQREAPALSCRRSSDVLLARSGVLEWRKSSFLVQHRFFKGDILAVEGVETRVWTGCDPSNPEHMKSRPIPAEVIRSLSRPRGSQA